VTLSDGRQRPILPVAGSHVRGGRGKPLDHALAHLPAAVDNLAAALTNAGLRTDGPLPAPGLWRLLRSRIYPADDATRRAASGASLAERLGLVGAGRWVGSTRASSRAGCGPPRRSPTSLRRSRSTGSCRVLSPVRCRRRHLSRRGSAVSRSSTTASGNCGSGTGEGYAEEEIAERWPEHWQRWRSEPYALEVEGRETLADLNARVAGALDELFADLVDGPVAVVFTHDGVVRAAVAWALGTGPEIDRHVEVANCSITTAGVVAGVGRLARTNENTHLEGLALEP
jgi:hypothetical protein